MRDAESGEDLDEVRRLFRAFVVWHLERQGQNAGLLASYFKDAAWQAELDGLPGEYAATEGGALLLAWDGGEALGCVALRQLGRVSQVLAAPDAAQITRWQRYQRFEDAQSARAPAPRQPAPGRRRHPPRLGRPALDDESCEMKRMYVDDAGRGKGIGRVLGEAVVQRARDLTYSAMYLDTSVEQHEAIGLYRSLGFQEVEPYYDVAPQMRGWLAFFRLTL